MLDRLGHGAIGVGVLLALTVLHHLRFGLWVLPFNESGKLQRRYLTGQPEGCGKPALPLTLHSVLLLVIALGVARVLEPVVGLGLSRADRFGDREHGGLEVL